MSKHPSAMMFLPRAIQIPLDDDGEEIEISDESEQVDKVYSQLAAETVLLDILDKLPDREKIFLLYQVLGMFGYSVSQERFAKTLDISRVNYINKLSSLKSKLRAYLYADK